MEVEEDSEHNKLSLVMSSTATKESVTDRKSKAEIKAIKNSLKREGRILANCVFPQNKPVKILGILRNFSIIFNFNNLMSLIIVGKEISFIHRLCHYLLLAFTFGYIDANVYFRFNVFATMMTGTFYFLINSLWNCRIFNLYRKYN